MTSVEERSRIIIVEIARAKRRYESGHVVLRPLPDVPSDVMEAQTVGREHVNRLPIIEQHVTRISDDLRGPLRLENVY